MTLLTRIKYLIPNLLSIFRLVVAAYFPLAPEHLWIWLIILGGGSDFLDGLLARRWQTTTWKGSLLDGIADKAFMLSALMTVAVSGRFSPYWIPLIILRDLTVAAVAVYTAYYRAWEYFKKMKAKWTGKLATAAQLLLLLVAALYPPAVPVILALTVIFSIVAALDYGRLFLKAVDGKPAGPDSSTK